jgi:hypothetical protein
MRGSKYLESCAQQHSTSVPWKRRLPISRQAPSPSSPPASTPASTTPTGFLRMKSSAELHLSAATAVDDDLFATAVWPDCCSERFIPLVLLRFKQCAPSRFIRRIHTEQGFVPRYAASALKSRAIDLLNIAARSVHATEYDVEYGVSWVIHSLIIGLETIRRGFGAPVPT